MTSRSEKRDKRIPLFMWIRAARRRFPHESPICVLTDDSRNFGLRCEKRWQGNSGTVYEVLARFVAKRGAISVPEFRRLEDMMMRRYGARTYVFGFDNGLGCVWTESNGNVLKTFMHYELPHHAVMAAFAVRKKLLDRKKRPSDEILMVSEMSAMLAAKGMSNMAKINRYRRKQYEAASINA